jgi:hypothetical protein
VRTSRRPGEDDAANEFRVPRCDNGRDSAPKGVPNEHYRAIDRCLEGVSDHSGVVASPADLARRRRRAETGQVEGQ